jgi:hypothetical protein
MTVEHLMCPPARRHLTSQMLEEVDQRLTELKYMAGFAFEITQDFSAEDEQDTNFTIARDQGDRLCFCVLNVESRIDDLIEFIKGVVA